MINMKWSLIYGKIALDAMGGDNAPAEIVKGAVQAIAADMTALYIL